LNGGPADHPRPDSLKFSRVNNCHQPKVCLVLRTNKVVDATDGACFGSITPTPRCSGQPSMIPKGTPIR
jgi:hypothetical protein